MSGRLSAGDVMTGDPVTIEATDSIVHAARLMRDHDIGDLLVADRGHLVGIVTDRDIVIRGIAESRGVETTHVGEVCSRDVVTVAPDDDLEQVVAIMCEHAVRRMPVVEAGRVVGVISLGDLAQEDGELALTDAKSVLTEISLARPNH
ncbi:MAG: CBS domain-containing protein [Hamadaea sp.]|uniref:CBS domain-containing protein n=1 Tax=Hamadaea sp. NPDC050747 TaxID=3155789 RepID=UPI0017BE654A|nr:CBS domain-containing protein [Hamadaea sp.]NUR49402.1 CBS domain-containing protein [Hamadaea sp.]NUT08495.1 CBS domain-containing protein [Hamadaea sp.]